MINANELRLGNTIEYNIFDNEAGIEEWVDNAVDIGDLQCLLEDPEDPFYRPKVLTEECLVEFGFQKEISTNKGLERWHNNVFFIDKINNVYHHHYVTIPAVHTLQNLHFAYTGEELKKKEVES
jgi:hypothetical protein